MLTKKEIEEFYNVLPLYIGNNTQYIRALKSKFILSVIDDNITTNNDNEVNKFLCNIAYCILDLYKFTDIEETYDEIYKKAYKLNSIKVKPHFNKISDNNFAPREATTISDTSKIIWNMMKINGSTINQTTNRLEGCFNALNESPLNEMIIEVLKEMMIKDISYISNTIKFYNNYLNKENINFELLSSDDAKYLDGMLKLSNALIGVWLKFICDDGYMELGLSLIGFAVAMSLIINIHSTDSEPKKYKTILNHMLILDFFKDYVHHYDKCYQCFVDHLITHETNFVNKIIQLYNNTEVTTEKKYYSNLIRISSITLLHYGSSFEGETKKIIDELFQSNNLALLQHNKEEAINLTKSIHENDDSPFISYFNAFAIFDAYYIPDLTQFDYISLFKREAIRIYDHYNYDPKFINGIRANLNKSITTTINFKILYNNDIKTHWLELSVVNKDLMIEILNNIEAITDILNHQTTDEFNQNTEQYLNEVLTNMWDRVESNYEFFNSNAFKNEMINSVEVETVRIIATLFYSLYEYKNDKRFLILGNEFTTYYIMRNIDQIINSFDKRLNNQDFDKISAHVTTLIHIFKIDNEDLFKLYNRYKIIMGKHYLNISEEYLSKYNSSTFNGDKLMCGYKLLCNLCKCSHYKKLTEDQIELCNKLNKIYNIPSYYFNFNMETNRSIEKVDEYTFSIFDSNTIEVKPVRSPDQIIDHTPFNVKYFYIDYLECKHVVNIWNPNNRCGCELCNRIVHPKFDKYAKSCDICGDVCRTHLTSVDYIIGSARPEIEQGICELCGGICPHDVSNMKCGDECGVCGYIYHNHVYSEDNTYCKYCEIELSPNNE